MLVPFISVVMSSQAMVTLVSLREGMLVLRISHLSNPKNCQANF